jgi:hypothetical protein
MLDIIHERALAQPLYDGVVVQQELSTSTAGSRVAPCVGEVSTMPPPLAVGDR